jgi:hypothetical protein
MGGSAGNSAITTTSGLTDIAASDLDTWTTNACTGWSSEGENSPALIDFVVDTSGSMKDPAPNTTDGRSKWAITSEALQNAIAGLPSMTGVGLLLWPNMPTVTNTDPQDISVCVNTSAMVPIAPLGPLGSDQRNNLDLALARVTPVGGTPMADAYNYALEYGMVASTLAGKRYMVLITDGQPTLDQNCVGTGLEIRPVPFQPVLTSIAAAWDTVPPGGTPLYVKTFVIGSPGSEHQSSTGADGRSLLSAAARAGGTGPAGCDDSGNPQYCHFDMSAAADFATGFAAALQNITGQILACDFTIPAPSNGQTLSTNSAQLNLVYKINGSSDPGQVKLIAPSDLSCPEGNGWYFDPTDPTKMHIIFCANTCNMIHQDAGAVLDFVASCAGGVVT